MKRLYTILFAVMALCATASAQQAELSKALQKYKNTAAFTAAVTQTRHRAALTDDETVAGQFYYKQGKGQCMTFESSGEMLLATPTAYTMVKDGRRRTVKAHGKAYNPFEAMTETMRQLINHPGAALTGERYTVKLARQAGSRCTVTVTPVAADAKAQRRLMFTSATATVDLNNSEIVSFRIDERNDNYIIYTFSHYRWNATVSDGVFSSIVSSSSSSSSSTSTSTPRRKR